MDARAHPDPFRLTEVLAALSLATDLANGAPMEMALRVCVLADSLARAVDADPVARGETWYAALLRFVGCTGYAHEEAAAFGGDDIALRAAYAGVDVARPAEVVATTLRAAARGQGALRRAQVAAGALLAAERVHKGLVAAQCDVAVRLATRLGMNAGVCAALAQIHERYDGRGAPGGLAGPALSLPARLLHIATVAEVVHRRAGAQAAGEVVRARAGTQFDPALARTFASDAPALCAPLGEPSVWEQLLEREPARAARPFASTTEAAGLDEVASAFADFVDLASVYTLGHSSGVARLAEGAAAALGLDTGERLAVRHAALLHDLGRVSVPAGIWEKRGALSAAEWERVRLHPYYTERVLARSPLLAPLAPLAGAHHERLDGSGYHRGGPAGVQLPRGARVIAAADAYHALTEDRPHRAALAPPDAARALGEEVSRGRLDARAADAVLAAAGQPRGRTPARAPAGLSEREVEVLCALARGRSNKEIAQALAISPRTVQHHVMHVYAKIGVNSRAGAALFAVEHGLLATTG